MDEMCIMASYFKMLQQFLESLLAHLTWVVVSVTWWLDIHCEIIFLSTCRSWPAGCLGTALSPCQAWPDPSLFTLKATLPALIDGFF